MGVLTLEIKIETLLNDCNTLAELQKTFTLEELIRLAEDKFLSEWLYVHFPESQAKLIDDEAPNRDALIIRLCEALSVNVAELSEYEANLVTAAVKRERHRINRESECGKDGIIVTNQAELIEALRDKDLHKVYLYGGEFFIPLNRSRITYDGRGNAVINILARDNEILDFDGKEIYFYNLTIAFHFLKPHQVNIKHSEPNNNHIIFLQAIRISRDDSVTAYELTSFLQGRKPFEPIKNFGQRAARFRGIIVGKVCLTDTDYDIRHETFALKAVWRVEFTELIRRYVSGAKLVFRIPPEEAAQLYESGRVQLIYADLGADDDNPAIVKLYLHANNGHGKIYPIYRVFDETAENFGSGSGCEGYGLELIILDSVNRKT